MRLTMTINGAERTAEVDVRMLLVDALRDVLGVTGPKIGCLSGDCGACTISLNGQIVKSCMRLAVSVDGADIRTLEGLAEDGQLSALQQAFWDNLSFQCGYCLSGMLFAAEDLLNRDQSPSEAEIRSAISGNLCRCTGYQAIVDAIKSVSVSLPQADTSSDA
ncbi:MAG TPA: (2Fe-2S)-binding protein [Solirubrobacteraceae bacterium]|jgi:carbon-monoxide dehydrogenase small subunit|nr:(2Fe-2S)-binding protein [Solirubrobacteraceae bacterium]